MAGDDDDFFGDFTFASNSQFTTPPPSKSTTPLAANEDDEWGDFVEYPSGSEPSSASSSKSPLDPFSFESQQQVTNKNTTTTNGWVKPSGALPLSLFGEQELEKPVEENTKNKVRNGSNANYSYGFDSITISNSYNQDHNFISQNGSLSNYSNKLNSKESNGLGFGPNSGSPCVSRVQSLNYLASLNDEVQQKSTLDSNNLSSAANVSSSIFVMSNPDFNMSKSNLTGLNRALSVDAITSLNDQATTASSGLDFGLNVSSSSAKSTSSSFGVWNPDFHMSKSNGLSRTLSLDVPSKLNNDQDQQIKTKSGGLGLVSNSNGSSSSVNASSSSFSGWDFDFGGLGSAIGGSNSIASSDVSGLNSNYNGVNVPSANLDAAHSNNDDDDDDGWEFKDAFSTSTVGDGNNKATSEAKEGHETIAFSFDSHNGLNGSDDLFATSNGLATADSKAHPAGDMQTYSSGFGNSVNGSIDLFATSNEPIDLFATRNEISAIHPDNIFGFDIGPSMASKNAYFSASDSRGEQKDSNDALDPHSVVGSAETDEDFGEFTTASSDSGLKLEEERKVDDVAHFELQTSKTDDKDQVKESKSENHKGALPLSIFGDEELETNGSSNIEDIFVPHNASFSKNDRSPDSNISINDLISNLYSQAEQVSPAHSVQVANSISDSPQDSVFNSNLVNGEDDLDEGAWEFKDCSSEMRMDNDTSEDPAQRSSSNLNQDNCLDLYSKLRNELYYHAKCHLDDLKRARSVDGLPVEEAKISTLNEEIEEACKDIDLDNAMCKGDHLEGNLSHNASMNAFIEILQEPKFQVLESEYHLSRRLSLVENDLDTTMDLIRHVKMMLKILKSGSLEEQSSYVSAWYKMIAVCAQELQHGSCIWKKILEINAQSHMLSHPRGSAFIRALGEIYRVAVVLEASVKLCKPWTWLNSAQSTSIQSLLDECHTMWSTSRIGEALSSMLDSASPEAGSSIASLLDSIKLIHGLDALTLQKHLFAQKEVCRLSLLTLEVLPGMKLIDWNGDHYFVTLANLWANLISSDPPELPHLIF